MDAQGVLCKIKDNAPSEALAFDGSVELLILMPNPIPISLVSPRAIAAY